jgi:hypothetical protein
METEKAKKTRRKETEKSGTKEDDQGGSQGKEG